MKRVKYLAAAGVLGVASAALAAAPTTQPVPVNEIPVPPARNSAPVARPVATLATASASTAHLPASVLVFAFAPTGEAQSVAWVGHAAQQTIVADLARLTDVQPSSATATPPASTDAALQQAAKAGVDAVIVGNVQAEGAQLRFTGQVLNVTTKRTIGGLTATGDFNDLFTLEDQLGKEAKNILRPPPKNEQVAVLTKADEISVIFDDGDAAAAINALNQSLEVPNQFEDQYDAYMMTPPYYNDWGANWGDLNYPLFYFPNPGWGWGYGYSGFGYGGYGNWGYRGGGFGHGWGSGRGGNLNPVVQNPVIQQRVLRIGPPPGTGNPRETPF